MPHMDQKHSSDATSASVGAYVLQPYNALIFPF